MPRYKLLIEYEGTLYSGWQKQPQASTVQQALEDSVYKFCREKSDIIGAGRTDAGVHALGQVAHVELTQRPSCYIFRQALNYYLKEHFIAVLCIEEVQETFHARFSAQKRRYLYRFITRSAPLTLERNRAWHVYKPLNLDAMQEGARYLLGTHDFSTFRSTECQAASPVKTLNFLDITQADDVITFFVEARSFLHHQVRNIVGTLKLVGEGKWSPQRVQDALYAKDRRAGGPTAPACGLYFHSVDYD